MKEIPEKINKKTPRLLVKEGSNICQTFIDFLSKHGSLLYIYSKFT